MTPFSVTRVRLAAQVLSETVGSVLNSSGPADDVGTPKCCLMMDNFFECLNVKNTMEYKVKQKPFLKPYTSVDDVRFAWLDKFSDYFKQWNDRGILHRMINPTCLFFGNLMKDSKLQFTHSKKFASFYLNRLFHTFYPNVSVKMIWRTILVVGHRRHKPTVRDAEYNDNTISIFSKTNC